ncbi:hypothetical protein [Nonomuraea sp. MG754425]|uniref:hypothetical protein n=1 Tax=Nonomuraea sp. MG754425 TaxID=2570319 RepID=UPI001F364E4C|nr:hypothetical protein [Nonomuraea sp. MG754425]
MNAARLARDSLALGTGAAVTLSALGVPAGWPFVGRMYVHQYDPQTFFDGAATWLAVHDDVAATRRNVGALVGEVAVPNWRSADGRAFERRMDAYLAGLRSIEIRAVVTAVTLYTAGAAFVAMILFQFLVAAAMAALAVWVLAAALTPPGLVAARATATRCLTGLFARYREVEKAIEALLHGCAAALGAAVVVDVAAEAARGDLSGLRDLASATFAQGPMLVWGTMNRVERDLTAHGLGGVNPGTGAPLPPGLTQVAGAKALTDVMGGGQTVTGRFAPGQAADGSYPFPWE